MSIAPYLLQNGENSNLLLTPLKARYFTEYPRQSKENGGVRRGQCLKNRLGRNLLLLI